MKQYNLCIIYITIYKHTFQVDILGYCTSFAMIFLTVGPGHIDNLLLGCHVRVTSRLIHFLAMASMPILVEAMTGVSQHKKVQAKFIEKMHHFLPYILILNCLKSLNCLRRVSNILTF